MYLLQKGGAQAESLKGAVVHTYGPETFRGDGLLTDQLRKVTVRGRCKCRMQAHIVEALSERRFADENAAIFRERNAEHRGGHLPTG